MKKIELENMFRIFFLLWSEKEHFFLCFFVYKRKKNGEEGEREKKGELKKRNLRINKKNR